MHTFDALHGRTVVQPTRVLIADVVALACLLAAGALTLYRERGVCKLGAQTYLLALRCYRFSPACRFRRCGNDRLARTRRETAA
jgi:hypothetical protein